MLIGAAVLATALAVAVGAIGMFARGGDEGAGPAAHDGSDDDGPLPVVSIPAPEADTDECRQIIEAAPEALTSSGEQLERRELAEPAPEATAAWGGNDEAVVLRCGLERPPELTRTATLRQINGVQWLHVPGEGSATWYAVDRPAYLAVTVPDGTGTGPLQRISDLADAELRQVPLTF
ncbi:hypothetical protein BJF85_17580 [Saccharomonospora sp. CUA-673]|uniref:DUF3515 domain-containing protein n=1 Tax=Saccharomonospora sp. CUA-673 TaxID=1904969 RepID=UPI00096449A1|nr:DUF3515 domain-containing protein [Saccharomonospora sp. CUA-673]OLT46265.1 hypothetical protein BJF85_17580 [Saccharomonospora sp. CUA-673]